MTRPIALLVDDVQDLLSVMAEVLEYSFPELQVLTATSARIARDRLSSAESAGAQLKVVIADQSLGDKTGIELLTDLAEERVPVMVLISGRASEELEREATSIGASVLWKPFRMAALTDHLRSRLTD